MTSIDRALVDAALARVEDPEIHRPITDRRGMFNDILAIFGLQRVAFFQYPQYFRALYIGSGIWQEARRLKTIQPAKWGCRPQARCGRQDLIL